MEYFIMDQDRRITHDRIHFKEAGFMGQEPFVTYLDLPAEEMLPDFLWCEDFDRPVFCVSDRMKDVMDYYGGFTREVPVFLVDRGYRSQRVYWIIRVKEQDCLRQELYVDKDQLTFRCKPEPGLSIFQAVDIRKQYLIVSLELAENLLRRQMYGLRFYPVREDDGKGG